QRRAAAGGPAGGGRQDPRGLRALAGCPVRGRARALRCRDRSAGYAARAGIRAGGVQVIRIANGQGFWGDWLEAPVRLVEQGPIDYLALDYLAEITMSILQKQRQVNPNLGYASDFPPLIARIASQIREREVKVIANAGGVNPLACA